VTDATAEPDHAAKLRGRLTDELVADVTIVSKRAHLMETGYTRVSVVLGDGEQGCAQHGPYDRIIVTVGAWDIPPAWVQQLTPDGTLTMPLRMPGLTGWELAAGTQELVRLRTVCVPASTPRAAWRRRPPAPYRDAAEGLAQPTQVLPIVTVGEWVRRGVAGGGRRPLMTRSAVQRAAPVVEVRLAGGRHTARRVRGDRW
jgi:hypothetical protein